MLHVILLIMFLNYFLLKLEAFLRSSNLNVLIRKLNYNENENCCVETDDFLESIDGTKEVSVKIIGLLS
ncbi:hypothetical protein PVNG_03090 [Plasmodium vivax North Korean]|uniref:Uncharacterized protein n=1 Tax=Plasmodium vivax North Korean TaxID=1035514 RepID=A0A0J9U1M0_PLAVI|nr:hypothetical protein PVNG_03090 [Plasmodium vivax North Korean]